MSARHIHAVTAILVLSAAYGCWCQAALIWDGAYQFDVTLATQHPFVYLTRFHTFFLWYPTVWASRITTNVHVLQAIFGLPFLLAPALGVSISWWIVRKDAPYLMIWVIFGVAAATVPGQIFVINDSLLELNLFWPLFVAVFVPLTWPQRIVLSILAIVQFIHPLGVPLLFCAACAAAVVAVIDQTNRRRLLTHAGVMGGLCLLAIAKIVVTNHVPRWFDSYAQQEATWENAAWRWRTAVSGAPLSGLEWMWTAAALVWMQPMLRRRWPGAARTLGVLALLCAARAALHWFFWAHDARCYWARALDYRRWVGPLAAPFLIFATLEALIHAWRGRTVDRHGYSVTARFACARGPLGVLVATVFAVTLGMQYMTWRHFTDKLMTVVRNYPAAIVPNTARGLSFVSESPLAHWGAGPYVAAMLGKQPDKLYLNEGTEKVLRAHFAHQDLDSQVHEDLSWFYEGPMGPAGWFDFRAVMERAKREHLAQWHRPVAATADH